MTSSDHDPELPKGSRTLTNPFSIAARSTVSSCKPASLQRTREKPHLEEALDYQNRCSRMEWTGPEAVGYSEPSMRGFCSILLGKELINERLKE